MKPRRILIFGNPGSGKTSLAKKLSFKTGIPWKDLDDFVWMRRFDTSRPRPARKRMLARILRENHGFCLERLQIGIFLRYHVPSKLSSCSFP